MRVHIAALAQALGIRPDRARIYLNEMGATTEKQRMIRSVTTFEEIIPLGDLFIERYSSCGPSFEPEERDEYYARRAELFPAYLARLSTVEELGQNTALLFTEESEEVAEKFAVLLRERIREAGDSMKAVWALKSLIPDRDNPVSYVGKHILRAALGEIFLAKLQNTLTTHEAVAVFASLKREDDRYNFLSTSGKRPWEFMWLRVTNLEDILLIEREVDSFFIDGESFWAKTDRLLRKEFYNLPRFADAFANALRFRGRDTEHKYDLLYTTALTLALEKVETSTELDTWLIAWDARAETCTAVHWEQKAALPSAFVKTWDKCHRGSMSQTPRIRDLKELILKSPGRSQVRGWAINEINALLLPKLATLTTPEGLNQFEKKHKGVIFGDLYSAFNQKKSEFMKAQMREVAATSDDLVELKQIFRSIAKEDPGTARLIVQRMAVHFPADDVDVISEPSVMIQ